MSTTLANNCDRRGWQRPLILPVFGFPYSSLRTADVFPVVASLRKITSASPSSKTFVANHSLAVKIKEPTRETSRKNVRGGHVYRSKLKGQRSLCTAALFLRTTRLPRLICPDCGTDWWNKHREDSYWREDYLFAYWSHWFITALFFWSYSKRWMS